MACEIDTKVTQKFVIKQKMGKGAYGIVWKAVKKKNGKVSSIKQLYSYFYGKMNSSYELKRSHPLFKFEFKF